MRNPYIYNAYLILIEMGSHCDGLVVSLSSHVVGCGFASWPVHTKDRKNGTNCLPDWQAGVRQCNPTDLNTVSL